MQATETSTSWFWAGEEPEWLVILTCLVALLLGGMLMYTSIGQMNTLSYENLSIRYPAQWMTTGDGNGGWAGVKDLGTQQSVNISILHTLDPEAPVTMDDLVTKRAFTHGQNTEFFRILESKGVQVGGSSAVMLSYAHVADAAGSSYQSMLPRVIRGADYLVPYKGIVYVISFENDANVWRESAIQRMLRSVRFD